jgi:hypothetical protein
MHARTGTCPKCGTDQPSKAKPVPEAQAVATSAPQQPTPPAPPKPSVGSLLDAVSFVRQVGGLEQAKKLLAEIDEIKKL